MMRTQKKYSARPGRLGRHTDSAFTRLELAVVLAVLGLLVGVNYPALCRGRSDADRAVCANNLRRIGQGIIGWGFNHQGQVPWRVPVSEGTMRLKTGNAWVEFAFISNYLVTPKILACPADNAVSKLANNWGNTPDGGFIHATHRGNSLSYFVGLDVGPAGPSGLLSGDRNVKVDGRNSTCSSGVNNAAAIYPFGQAAWTNDVHGPLGNVLFMDGTVAALDSDQLHQAARRRDDNGSLHFLFPR